MNLSLHHIGIVVKDIPEAADLYVRRFGHEVKTEIIHDQVQTAYVQFLRLPGDSVYVELVSPDGPGSKLTNALNKGEGLNHLCYSTDDIEAECARLRGKGLILLCAPVSAAAFQGRRIAWLMGADRVPFELVERGGQNEL